MGVGLLVCGSRLDQWPEPGLPEHGDALAGPEDGVLAGGAGLALDARPLRPRQRRRPPAPLLLRGRDRLIHDQLLHGPDRLLHVHRRRRSDGRRRHHSQLLALYHDPRRSAPEGREEMIRLTRKEKMLLFALLLLRCRGGAGGRVLTYREIFS